MEPNFFWEDQYMKIHNKNSLWTTQLSKERVSRVIWEYQRVLRNTKLNDNSSCHMVAYSLGSIYLQWASFNCKSIPDTGFCHKPTKPDVTGTDPFPFPQDHQPKFKSVSNALELWRPRDTSPLRLQRLPSINLGSFKRVAWMSSYSTWKGVDHPCPSWEKV